MTETLSNPKLKGIEIVVYGRPQSKGSKKSFVNKRKDGSTFAGMKDTNDKAKPWQASIRAAAAEVYCGPLLRQPCRIDMTFYFKRPNSHYGTGRNAGKLKASAPKYHDQIPDKDKCERIVSDGLEGVVVDNDKRFCQGETRREWTENQERVEIVITPLL